MAAAKDIAKAQKNSSKTPQTKTLICNHAQHRRLSALHRAISILEILERILSFLPEQSLRQVASVVCKDWLTVCRPLFNHVYNWTDSPRAILVTLPTLPSSPSTLDPVRGGGGSGLRRRLRRSEHDFSVWGWGLHRMPYSSMPSRASAANRHITIIPEPGWLRRRVQSLTTLKCKLSPRTFYHATTISQPGFTMTTALTVAIAEGPAGSGMEDQVTWPVPTLADVMTTTMDTLQNRARADLLRTVQELTEARKLSLLELQIEILDDYEGFLRPLLRSATMVTSLWLKKTNIPLLPLGLVLRQCRGLEEIRVECDVHSSRPRLIAVLFSPGGPPDSDEAEQREHGSDPLGKHAAKGLHLRRDNGLLDNGLPRKLRLKLLQLKDVLLKESTLMAILDSAPDLYDLKIQSLDIAPASPSTSITTITSIPMTTQPGAGATTASNDTYDASATAIEDWVSCDKMELFHELGLLYPQLTSLHFTRAQHRYTDAQIRTILGCFPRASRWSLVWRDLPDGILRDLNNCIAVRGSVGIYTNHLCSLEIVPSADWTPRWGNALHEFLCSSPQLEHLRAGSIAYYIENLDLNGILPATEDHWSQEDDGDGRNGVDVPRSSTQFIHANSSTHASKQPVRKVWACRNLKTLHLEFTRRYHLQHYNALRSSYSTPASSASATSTSSSRSSSSTSASSSSGVILENSPKLSRVVFGYISRFCPRLQNLLIRGYRLNMTLDGGFTLLTRLRNLKRVAISQYDCQFSERDILPWIMKRKSSMTITQRLQWRAIFAGWWRLVYRKELGVTMNAGANEARHTAQDRGRNIECLGEAVAMVGLEKLGRLSDVVDVLRDITAAPVDASSFEQPETLWTLAELSENIWPELECVRIVYGNLVKQGTKDVIVRELLKRHRPEVEFQWVSWLDQYY